MAFSRKFQPSETPQDDSATYPTSLPPESEPAQLKFPKKGRPGQKSSGPPQRRKSPAKKGGRLKYKGDKKLNLSGKDQGPFTSSPRELFRKSKRFGGKSKS